MFSDLRISSSLIFADPRIPFADRQSTVSISDCYTVHNLPPYALPISYLSVLYHIKCPFNRTVHLNICSLREFILSCEQMFVNRFSNICSEYMFAFWSKVWYSKRRKRLMPVSCDNR